jgi:hypothetical protein
MSAMSVEVTELHPAPVAVRSRLVGLQRRGAHRVVVTTAHRTRLRWSVFSLVLLGCAFALTVGILDVLL